MDCFAEPVIGRRIRADPVARNDERLSTVVARLDRAIQYSEKPVIEPGSRGVLDTPLSRSMTSFGGAEAVRHTLGRHRPPEPVGSPWARLSGGV
jgi:hypothetical protein